MGSSPRTKTETYAGSTPPMGDTFGFNVDLCQEDTAIDDKVIKPIVMLSNSPLAISLVL